MLSSGVQVTAARKGPAGGPLTVADLLASAHRGAASAAEATPVALPLSPVASGLPAQAQAQGEDLSSSLALSALEPLSALERPPTGAPPGTPIRRLMIERVVLENFKSYNKKRVIGPFHKRFTAIVGPNGSGKSNVIDAMLFVFGRRAQQIRLRKVTELIHNSAAASAAARAGDEEGDPARPKKKHASGDTAASEKQQEEHALIDRASVSIFFQEIIDPRPEETGLLEFLEDLVGSNRFVEPIEKASEQFDELCQQVHTAICGGEGDGGSVHCSIHEGRVVQRSTRVARYQEKANRMRCASTELRRLEGPKEEALESLKADRHAAGAKLLLAAIFRRIEGEAATHVEQLKAVEAECATAERALQKLVVRDEELRAELVGEQRDAAHEADKVKKAEEAVETAKEAVEQYQESIKGEVQQLSEAHVAAEKLLLQQQQQVDKHLTATAKTTSALEMLERKERQIRERQQQAQAALKQSAEEGNGDAHIGARAEAARYKRPTQTGKLPVFSAEQQRQETRCSGRLQSLLAQEKRQGKLRGLIDRLGELGSIDTQYEKAFLAASGGFSGFFVVEAPEDATELFALLRAHELGRCNVLALRVLEKDLSQRLEEADREAATWKDSSAPRLLDLLRFSSPRLRVAFFKAVGSTRVAQDMDHASHIAYSLRQRETERHLERQRVEAESALELLQQDMAAAQLHVASAGALQSTLHAAVKEQESVVSSLLQKLQNAGGEEMHQRRAKLLKAERALNRLKEEAGRQQEELAAKRAEALRTARDANRLKREILTHEKRTEGLQEALAALENEAKDKRRELRSKEAEVREAATLREDAKTHLEALRGRRKAEFVAAFAVIAAKLKETYRMLSQGGDAELELGDPADPFAEGVILSIRPPKKRGERTLSSLSLVFALHHYKPTCVYFLDEIDAALDHRNVAILGAFVLQKARDAQFIIISLRNQLFELANRLVGIYKTFDATKSVSLDPSRLAADESENQKQQHQLDTCGGTPGNSSGISLALPAPPLLPVLPGL
ncbi:SMC N-terminal domain-containing protein [Cyclospora cayetanensis]|uniref:SMC N-terminal domain-containing protein n=1 Tax=Cyclospora cayetanensis TaxID=88456 RepID=A0A1D3D6G3_9EIME|nr:SMC N-terminal domain-containing protein [Cyclospora cayetanensis]